MKNTACVVMVAAYNQGSKTNGAIHFCCQSKQRTCDFFRNSDNSYYFQCDYQEPPLSESNRFIPILQFCTYKPAQKEALAYVKKELTNGDEG